jgi:RNA-directed DNA polymerase
MSGFSKYRKSSTGRILGLHDGGTSSLANFIATYKKETAKFKAPGQQQPVIIIYDNDSGAKAILHAANQAARKKLSTTQPFEHVFRNLYLVPTPLLNGAGESKIEDFFDASVKATVVAGKTFNETNTFDTATQYGKKVFAYKVVRPNADTIDFSGFEPLLTNLVSAMQSHAPAAVVTAATTI